MRRSTVKFGKGAIRDKYDIRTYQYTPRGAFDWATGFDVEAKMGSKLVQKDQGSSSSCGGQAFSYYMEVLETIATNTYEPRSARWPYSHVFAPGGGSMGQPLCNFLVKNGSALEKDAPSYFLGKPPTESFMEAIPDLTPEALDEAQTSRALSYVQVDPDIDIIAQAIADNNGCCIALYGQDNGTWHSAFPQPPTKNVWAHWLYAGKVKLIGGKKYIGVKNSWGDGVGDKDGWQWLGEEYFPYIWYGWTLAWDYKPAAHKVAMIKMIALLNQAIVYLKELISLKK